MSSTIIKTTFSDWHTMRWIALAIGLFLGIMAILYEDAVTGLFSGFFIFQAVTNTGCMVSQSCGVPQQEKLKNSTEQESEIHFTEVK